MLRDYNRSPIVGGVSPAENRANYHQAHNAEPPEVVAFYVYQLSVV
jgi:hypothetical protein